MVVGLRSVDQLCLYAQISGFQGITEVYNLGYAGNPDDHKCIPEAEKAGVSNPWTGGIFSQQTQYKTLNIPYSGPWYSEVLDMGI